MKAPEQGRILDSQCIYEGKIVRLEVDQLEFGGRATIREVVRHPGGVVLLGIRDDGLIPFVRQLRYPMQEKVLELPAGKLDPGEDPREAAAREMEEETGYRPVDLEHVFSFYSTPGFCDELLHLFYSSQLIETARNPFLSSMSIWKSSSTLWMRPCNSLSRAKSVMPRPWPPFSGRRFRIEVNRRSLYIWRLAR